MSLAPGQPVGDQGLAAVQKDDPNVIAPVHQYRAIGAFQRGAGHYNVAAGIAYPVDLIGDRLQPGPAIFVGERMTGAHLGDVAWGMKTVAVLKGPLQTLGEGGCDRALARTRYAHHD